jgi:hypothetical protein
MRRFDVRIGDKWAEVEVDEAAAMRMLESYARAIATPQNIEDFVCKAAAVIVAIRRLEPTNPLRANALAGAMVGVRSPDFEIIEKDRPVRLWLSDFTRTPGARYRADGPFSGQEYREDHLVPAYERAVAQGVRVHIGLDGVDGHPPSFLEEAFGGLARVYGADAVLARFKFGCDSQAIISRIVMHILGANEQRPTRPAIPGWQERVKAMKAIDEKRITAFEVDCDGACTVIRADTASEAVSTWARQWVDTRPEFLEAMALADDSSKASLRFCDKRSGESYDIELRLKLTSREVAT